MVSENRKNLRYVFPKAMAASATLIPEHGGDSLPAVFLNISVGGVGLAVRRDKSVLPARNQQFTLQDVQPETLAFLNGIQINVRWLLICEQLEHAGLGCSFVGDYGEALEEKIAELY